MPWFCRLANKITKSEVELLLYIHSLNIYWFIWLYTSARLSFRHYTYTSKPNKIIWLHGANFQQTENSKIKMEVGLVSCSVVSSREKMSQSWSMGCAILYFNGLWRSNILRWCLRRTWKKWGSGMCHVCIFIKGIPGRENYKWKHEMGEFFKKNSISLWLVQGEQDGE